MISDSGHLSPEIGITRSAYKNSITIINNEETGTHAMQEHRLN
jgi:hypothetical protein